MIVPYLLVRAFHDMILQNLDVKNKIDPHADENKMIGTKLKDNKYVQNLDLELNIFWGSGLFVKFMKWLCFKNALT